MEIARSPEPSQSPVHFRFSDIISEAYGKMLHRPLYAWALIILGLPVHLVTFFIHWSRRGKQSSSSLMEQIRTELIASGDRDELKRKYITQLERKHAFSIRRYQQHSLNQRLNNGQRNLSSPQYCSRLKNEEEPLVWISEAIIRGFSPGCSSLCSLVFHYFQDY